MFNEKGSITIEASLILPFSIIIIVGIILSSIKIWEVSSKRLDYIRESEDAVINILDEVNKLDFNENIKENIKEEIKCILKQ